MIFSISMLSLIISNVELKDIIRQKCLRIDIELCEKACQSVVARMRKCIQVEGEVLYLNIMNKMCTINFILFSDLFLSL